MGLCVAAAMKASTWTQMAPPASVSLSYNVRVCLFVCFFFKSIVAVEFLKSVYSRSSLYDGTAVLGNLEIICTMCACIRVL